MASIVQQLWNFLRYLLRNFWIEVKIIVPQSSSGSECVCCGEHCKQRHGNKQPLLKTSQFAHTYPLIVVTSIFFNSLHIWLICQYGSILCLHSPSYRRMTSSSTADLCFRTSSIASMRTGSCCVMTCTTRAISTLNGDSRGTSWVATTRGVSIVTTSSSPYLVLGLGEGSYAKALRQTGPCFRSRACLRFRKALSTTLPTPTPGQCDSKTDRVSVHLDLSESVARATLDHVAPRSIPSEVNRQWGLFEVKSK